MQGALERAWRSPATRWLLLLLATACASGWYLELRPLAAVWGDIATWVGGIATSAGLFFAASQIRLANQQRSREEARHAQEELQRKKDDKDRRLAMARAVGVRSIANKEDSGTWTISFTVQNGGEYPIENVMLVISDPGAPAYAPENQQGTALQYILGSLMSKETISEEGVVVNFRGGPVFGESTNLASILFTDTWGQNWAKTPLGGLIEKEHPPRAC